jgi:hypothetical protein
VITGLEAKMKNPKEDNVATPGAKACDTLSSIA